MPEAGVEDAILSCWLNCCEVRKAAVAAGVPVVVRRAFENRADLAEVWLAMARVAKLRDGRRVRLVAVRMAAEAEVEGLIADGGGSSIYNLGGRSLDENRQMVLLRLPAAVASFHAAMLGMIGGIWVESYSGVCWRAKALPRFADVWLTEPCSLLSRRGLPSLEQRPRPQAAGEMSGERLRSYPGSA